MAFSINYIYKLIDKYSPQLKKMTAAAKKFDAGVGRMQKGLGKMQAGLAATGGRLANMQTGLASLGAGMFLKSAMEESLKFNKALNMTNAVIQDLSADNLDLLRQKALKWGAETQFSSVMVADAMAEFGKKGMQVNEILAIMPGTMALAASGEMSMAEAAMFTTDILAQFGKQVDEAGGVSDLLAKSASVTATSVTEMAMVFQNSGTMARMAGIGIQDTAIAAMAMAKQGQRGFEAGTKLKGMFIALQNLSGPQRKALQGLGVDIDKYRNSVTGQVTDLWGLVAAYKASGDEGIGMLKTVMPNIRAGQAFATLLNTETSDLDKFTQAALNNAGAADKMKEKLMAGPVGAMIRLQSVTGNLKVMIGGFTSEALLPLIEKLTVWLGNMQQNNPEMLKMITNFLIGVTAVGAMIIPIGLLAASLSSLIGLFLLLTNAVKMHTIATKIASFFTKIWSGVQAVLNVIMAANPIVLIVSAIILLIGIIVLVIQKTIGFKKVWQGVTDVFWIVVDAIKTGAMFIWDVLLKLYNSPFFRLLKILLAPFFIVPILIIKFWGPISTVFKILWQVIKIGVTTSLAFFAMLGRGIGSGIRAGVAFALSGIRKIWTGFKSLLDNPFFAALATIFLPFLTIPALIQKHWEPIKALFGWIWDKLKLIGGIAKWFFGFGDNPLAKNMSTPPSGLAPPAASPNRTVVDASASVSVYTEDNMKTAPFIASGNLGYNLRTQEAR